MTQKDILSPAQQTHARLVLAWEALAFFVYAICVAVYLSVADLASQTETAALGAYALFLVFGVILLITFIKNTRLKRNLARRQAILGAVLESSTSGRIITNPKGRTEYLNSHYLALHTDVAGETPQAIESLRRLFRHDLDCLARFDSYLEKASTEGGSIALPYLDAAGETGWMEVEATPIPGWSGFIHWRAEDITDQREVDDKLRKERMRFIDFMDNAPVGFFSVNEVGAFIFANDTFASWLGMDRRDLVKTPHYLHDFLVNPPANRPAFCLMDSDSREQRGRILMRGKTGRVFQAAVSHAILENTAEGLRTRSVIRDLTPEEEWREALRASEDRFQEFFDAAPLGTILLNEDNEIVECNPAFMKLVRRDLSKLLHQPFQSLALTKDRQKIKQKLENLRKGTARDEPIEIEVSLPDDDGQPLSLQIFAVDLPEAGIILHCIDQTEQKTLETQFAQSQKMQAVGQLAGGVAHDFNNLLTAMIGHCDLLLQRHKPGDPSFSDIMQIKQNGNRAANLVRQLLAFSRQQTLQARVIDVTDAITEVSHLLRRLIGANIELELKHARDLAKIKADQGQLEQVLINLAVNARDAIGDSGGKISINTDNHSSRRNKRIGNGTLPKGDWVRITVRDTGSGIPPETLERIFDPFFSTKSVGEGTGLGLSTVHGIIHQTGGHIFVESEVGKGTTFIIFLPQISEHDSQQDIAETTRSTSEALSQPSVDLTGSARILLAEDEDAVRSFATRTLKAKGYEVFDAASGEKALEQLDSMIAEGQPPALLVTDVIMPEMDGIELMKTVRETLPDIRVIVMSGYTEDKYKDELDPKTAFLAKPFSLKALAEKVKDML